MEDEATLRSEIKSNGRATRVMCHKWLPDNLSGWVQFTLSVLKLSTHKPLNHHPQNLEPLPHGSFHSKMTNPWAEGATEEGKNLG